MSLEAHHQASSELEKPAVSRYLKGALGRELTKASAEALEIRPADPIEYIAMYLYKYADRRLYYYEQRQFNQELEMMRLRLADEKRMRSKRMYKLRSQLEHFDVAASVRRREDVRHKDLWQTKSEMESSMREIDYEAAAKAQMLEKLSLGRMDMGKFSGLVPPGHGEFRDADFFMFRDLDRRGRDKNEGDKLSKVRDGKGKRRTFMDEKKSPIEGEEKEEKEEDKLKRRTAGEGADKVEVVVSSMFAALPDDPEDADLDPITRALRKAQRLKALYGDGRGQKIVPQIATWEYIVPPGKLICKHPVLGKMCARGPRKDINSRWDGYSCMNTYEHDIYVICDLEGDKLELSKAGRSSLFDITKNIKKS